MTVLTFLRKKQLRSSSEDLVTDHFEPPAPLRTAVLFLVFNRPDTTAQVFEAIRKAKPPRLYVAADGPRGDREGEVERVNKVREIATAVDWPCEVKTLFRDENLGCKAAVSGAITWFFEHEEQGIILEDDCVPNKDFFPYCEWALNEFRDVPEVWHINGNNFGAATALYGGNSISFCSLGQVWGWATWANRWKNAQMNPFYLSERVDELFKNWSLTKKARIIKKRHLLALKSGLDTWDFQWQVSILNAGGLAVSASSNLISNLGDGPDATHTKFDKDRIRLPTQPFSGFSYAQIVSNPALTKWYEKKMGMRSTKRVIQILISDGAKKAKLFAKLQIQKVLFGGFFPVVVASTGRSGSTMLANAVAASLIKTKFHAFPTSLHDYIKRFSIAYLDRITDIDQFAAPILKTHDLFRKEFSDKAKFIFVYGDPLESAQSVEQMKKKRGSIWVEEHIYHLVGNGTPHDIFTEDVLNYECQMRLWGEAKGAFLIHYDDIWNKNTQLSRFLGFDVELPKKRARSLKGEPLSYNKALFDRLKKMAQHKVGD